jgi:DNA-binding SARP family transcriptional activator
VAGERLPPRPCRHLATFDDPEPEGPKLYRPRIGVAPTSVIAPEKPLKASSLALVEGVRFSVLGRLRVLIEGCPQQLGGPLEQSVLLRLLLAHSQPVTVERLADEVWQEEPAPPSPGTVHSYVARLRRRLGSARTLLTTSNEGYVLTTPTPMVDAWAFELALDRALAAIQRPADVCAILEPALRLWADTRAFGSLGDRSWAMMHAHRLQERRLIALETLAEAELLLNHHVSALLRLQDVAGEHPHRESLTRFLMTALYRAGRQGDALAAYERCRRALDDDLGVEPSCDLRAAHQAVLLQSPSFG